MYRDPIGHNMAALLSGVPRVEYPFEPILITRVEVVIKHLSIEPLRPCYSRVLSRSVRVCIFPNTFDKDSDFAPEHGQGFMSTEPCHVVSYTLTMAPHGAFEWTVCVCVSTMGRF